MTRLANLMISVLLIPALVVPSLSQNPVRNASNDAGEQMTMDELRARWLLEELFEHADACDDEVFKIRIQADISDLLWKYNEPLARLQFQAIIRTIAELKYGRERDAHENSTGFDMQALLRFEVLDLIRRHDPEWADKLGDSFDIPSEKPLARPPESGKSAHLNPGLILKSFNSGKPVSFTTSPDLLIQTSANGTVANRDGLFFRAAQQSIKEKNFEQALEITGKISQPRLRSRLETTARSRAAMAALALDDYNAALKHLRAIPDIPQRATLYNSLIKRLWDKRDTSRVIDVLSEAEHWISKTDDSPVRVRVLLTLVDAAASFDPQRGFELMQIAVSAINRAIDQGDFEIHTSIIERSFQPLARADFTRALQLAQAIERKEISLQAQFAICQGLLRL